MSQTHCESLKYPGVSLLPQKIQLNETLQISLGQSWKNPYKISLLQCCTEAIALGSWPPFHSMISISEYWLKLRNWKGDCHLAEGSSSKLLAPTFVLFLLVDVIFFLHLFVFVPETECHVLLTILELSTGAAPWAASPTWLSAVINVEPQLLAGKCYHLASIALGICHSNHY